MRGQKTAIGICGLAALCVGAALAQPRYESAEVKLTNNQTNSVTLNPQGRIVEVLVLGSQTNGVTLSTGAATGTVTVVSTPAVNSGLTATTLFTATMTNNTVTARTRIVPTANTGAALSTLTVAEPHLNVGDPVVFQVVQAASGLTNVSWKCWLKVE